MEAGCKLEEVPYEGSLIFSDRKKTMRLKKKLAWIKLRWCPDLELGGDIEGDPPAAVPLSPSSLRSSRHVTMCPLPVLEGTNWSEVPSADALSAVGAIGRVKNT